MNPREFQNRLTYTDPKEALPRIMEVLEKRGLELEYGVKTEVFPQWLGQLLKDKWISEKDAIFISEGRRVG